MNHCKIAYQAITTLIRGYVSANPKKPTISMVFGGSGVRITIFLAL
jgi:hypothetical protein